MQNGFIESFTSRTRDDLLKESLFFGVDHARSDGGSTPQTVRSSTSGQRDWVSNLRSMKVQ
jgi:hypothetical protein